MIHLFMKKNQKIIVIGCSLISDEASHLVINLQSHSFNKWPLLDDVTQLLIYPEAWQDYCYAS